MRTIELADAQRKFDELIIEVESGETIEITRNGRPVARMTAPATRKPIDVAALRALAEKMPMQEEGAGDFVRRMRDEERY